MSGDILRKPIKKINIMILFLPALIVSFLTLYFLNEMANAYLYADFVQTGISEELKDNNIEEGNIQDEKNEEVNPFENFDIETFKLQNSEAEYVYDERYPILNIKYENAQNNYTIKHGSAYLKNLTDLSNDEVRGIMAQDINFNIQKNSSEPQILIMHTHGTESYQPEGMMSYDPSYTSRDTDNNQNITSVGKVLADTLNSFGYNTLHDTSLHDYPSYNGSYDRSREVVEEYLLKYPSIKIVLDIHRDAIETNGARVAAVSTINGIEYAQVMIISGADNKSMGMPNYTENLKFAALVQDSLEESYTGITRPILFDYRHYNQDLTTGSILIEVGSHGNTLSQAKQTAKVIGVSIAKIFDERQD